MGEAVERVDIGKVLSVCTSPVPLDAFGWHSLVAHTASAYGFAEADTAVLVGDDGKLAVSVIGPGATARLPLVWGTAVGDHGPITHEEADRALHDPSLARRLLGVFVLVGRVEGALRIVTSPGWGHTLKVTSAARTAWSTKALTAALLAGREPVVDPARLPDLLTFDLVLAGHELLEGVSRVDRASTIELRPGLAATTCYWPEGEALDGPPTEAADLRAVLGDATERLAAVPDVWLGLTAGRDSTLLASCAFERGATLPTFTMGEPTWPDAVGAKAVAAAIGWEHRVLAPPVEVAAGKPGLDLAVAVANTPWTDGVANGRNLFGDDLRWDGPDICWLTGSGGAVGRGIHWRRALPDQSERALLLARGEGLGREAHGQLTGHIDESMDALREQGFRGRQLLDVFYLAERMGSWTSRNRRLPWVHSVVSPYPHPDVARVLLHLPEADRPTGAAFDRAHALGRPNLLEVAQPDRVERGRSSALLRRVGGPFKRAIVPRTGQTAASSPDLQQLDAVLAATAGLPFVSEVLGRGYLSALRAEAVVAPGAMERLWYAVSVELFARRLAQLQPWRPGMRSSASARDGGGSAS